MTNCCAACEYVIVIHNFVNKLCSEVFLEVLRYVSIVLEQFVTVSVHLVLSYLVHLVLYGLGNKMCMCIDNYLTC